MLDTSAVQIKLIRKYLKLKITEDNITFNGHNLERNHVYEIMKKSIVNGESQSALLIGPRGCGKTTLINSVLSQLSNEVDLENNAIIVKLNGLIHHDEKIALKSITSQMQLDNAVGDKVFGTFAENLAYLLSCLQSGADRRCKSMIFILEEFDLFCHSGRTQTLLYNLFDITHSGLSPVCVLGLTARLDVMDLLEKRVKSRFSHRHIFIFPNQKTDPENNFEAIQEPPLERYKNLCLNLLSMPLDVEKKETQKKKKVSRKKSVNEAKSMDVDSNIEFALPKEVLLRCKVDINQFKELDQNFLSDWNEHVKGVVEDEKTVDSLEKLCYYTVNEQIFRDVLFQTVSKLSPSHPFIDNQDLSRAIDNAVCSEDKVEMLQSLSILELSLVIAMKHGLEIFDGQPLNFEMIWHRYTKFVNANSSTQSVPRPVVLKAFEHLQALEIVTPVKNTDSYSTDTTTSRVQKEYQLYTLNATFPEVEEAVKKFKSLPTEITHWFSNYGDYH